MSSFSRSTETGGLGSIDVRKNKVSVKPSNPANAISSTVRSDVFTCAKAISSGTICSANSGARGVAIETANIITTNANNRPETQALAKRSAIKSANATIQIGARKSCVSGGSTSRLT